MRPDIPQLIEGGSFEDHRGRLDFVNDFDAAPIKRVYFSTNANTEFIRAWQGHKIESRWFMCVKGSFKVKLIKIEDYENPPVAPDIYEFILDEDKPNILYIPNSFVNGFQSLKDDSKLLIMSNFGLGENPNDDFRFTLNEIKWND